MNYKLIGKEPASALRFFEEISAIPRGSGNEEHIADYLCQFARDRNLPCYRDSYNNVLITKKASAGKETIPPVMLQGHTDMVCEKNKDTLHDFTKDGIDLILEGSMLRANNTTLGADDGAAVASMLAILDDKNAVHPDLECLFTTGEEVGLTGAENFDYSLVKSRRMINIDSEEEALAVVSSAGGLRALVNAESKYIPVPEDVKFYRFDVTGLMGGHSGTDIAIGRKCASRLAAEFLKKLADSNDLYLVSIDGGSKDNAITREAMAIFASHESVDVDTAAKDFYQITKASLHESDRNLKMQAAECSAADNVFPAAFSKKVIDFLCQVPFGVVKMSEAFPDIPETSINIGIVKTTSEDQAITVKLSMRSSAADGLDNLAAHVKSIAESFDFNIRFDSRYPGWEYSPNSQMQRIFIDSYRKLFPDSEKKPDTVVIHAGLECGLIKAQIPDMDIIAIGPDVFNIHTPDEALDIASFDRTYRLIVYILSEIE